MCLITDCPHGDARKVINFRETLAVALRSIQWSYAILWTPSTRQQGLLEWGNGYYNGDIKTRKTLQSSDVHTHKKGLQRSKQLRELYEFLLEGDPEQQGMRQSAALSPEDLSNEEWYYLMSMTYVFDRDEGLPGRASTSGKPIWLSAASSADSSLFSRSLLAKSASIQTVVCFPHQGGVIEFGVTELVSEDPSLLQHIKTSLLEISKPICSEEYCCSHTTDDDKDPFTIGFNCRAVVVAAPPTKVYLPSGNCEFNTMEISDLHENDIDSLDVFSAEMYSNECEHDDELYNTFMVKDSNLEVMDVQRSEDCNDCITGMSVSVPEKKNESPVVDGRRVLHPSWDFEADNDSHYKRTLSSILVNSNGFETLWSSRWNSKSSFLRWADEGKVAGFIFTKPQRVLKSILFSVPYFYEAALGMKKSVCKTSSDDFADVRGDKANDSDEFNSLRSIIPSVGKEEEDKTTILGQAIEFVKELEAKVVELKSLAKNGADEKVKGCTDKAERTSDNYDGLKAEIGFAARKRKAVGRDEVMDAGVPFDMKVEMEEEEAVLIVMKCPWRDYLLVDIMEAINNLHLDAYAVQSSTLGGVLSLTLHSKFRGAAVSSAGVIKRALWKVVVACSA